ncbi:MAG TPA: BadF/BadG/BcrA/BcrD ATPase family protein [Gaiellaceae bacterium]
MGVVLGVDGGNSKTDVVVATTEGEPLSYVRGGGSNSHGRGGSAGCIDVVASLVDLEERAERAVLFLCGADLPHDIEELSALARSRDWARELTVDNDTFALLHAGTDRADAAAVICGAGINCVGRRADGRVARYPALGWETGDWGGGEGLARDALFLANRAADGRGEPTALVELFESHFGKPVVEIGIDVHYKRMRDSRLGELAAAIVDLGDPVAERLVQRLVDEIVLLVERALRDLELAEADIVLGGGMLTGRLLELVSARVPSPVVPDVPPVAGAVLAALDADARTRFRETFRGWKPRD